MAATAEMAARLRRMVDEPTEATYDDDLIDDYIEAYPLLDALGTDPYEIDFSTEPPTLSERDEWIPTYDLSAAARDIWLEKASAIADDFDFSADGGKYSRSQKVKQYTDKARYYGSQRATKTIKIYPDPRRIVTEEAN
jgi:hypothetical protein